MNDMRQDQLITTLVDKVLEQVIARAPFLTPRGQPLGGETNGLLPGGNSAGHAVPGIGNVQNCNNVSSKDSVLSFPHEIASKNTVSYAEKINANNINLPSFVYGYSCQLLSVLQGQQQQKMSSVEFQSRVSHLVNVMEVCMVNSNLSDHNDKSWQIAKEYNNRVVADIAKGSKSWSELSPNMAPDCYVFAKDHTNARSNKSEKDDKSDKSDKTVKKDKDVKGSATCKDYNTKSNSGESCSWELDEANAGKRCNRLHCCSTCMKSGQARSHRAMDCSNSAKNQTPFQSQGSGT